MKIRTGFVSNSSSSSFVMDLTLPGVREYFQKHVAGEIGKKRGWDLGRQSGYYRGQDAVDFANEIADYLPGLAADIHETAAKVGAENVLVVMASDEGMGGYLEDYPPDDLVRYQGDYH